MQILADRRKLEVVTGEGREGHPREAAVSGLETGTILELFGTIIHGSPNIKIVLKITRTCVIVTY